MVTMGRSTISSPVLSGVLWPAVPPLRCASTPRPAPGSAADEERDAGARCGAGGDDREDQGSVVMPVHDVPDEGLAEAGERVGEEVQHAGGGAGALVAGFGEP